MHLVDAPSAFTSVEAETIAREALAKLGPRLAELVVEHEESEEPTDDDELAAYHRAWSLNGDDGDVGVGLYLELLRIEARRLVSRYAAAIVRVADALERQAVLQGDAVAALVFPPRNGTPKSEPAAEADLFR